MRAPFLAAALIFIAIPAFALGITIVSPKRAAQSQGNVVAVRGRVEIRPDLSVEGTDVNLLNSSGDVVFIGFIPKGNEGEFPQLDRLNGRRVVMYGVIDFYRGLPSTQLTEPSQLRPA